MHLAPELASNELARSLPLNQPLLDPLPLPTVASVNFERGYRSGLRKKSRQNLAPRCRGIYDGLSQDLRHYGDGDIINRAHLVAGQAVELTDMDAGHENDRRLLESRMLVDETRGLEAIHVRHADIEQHHGKLLAHQLVERLEPRAH